MYLTNRYERARSYAKGGKATTLVILRDDVRWLEQTKLPVAPMQAYLRKTPRFRWRDLVLTDLIRSAERQGSDVLGVSNLVNLCVYHGY